MGFIINIDEALKLRTDYNVLREPLNALLQEQQEAWEKKNPIDLLFVRGTLNGFQQTYTSSIGFKHAFAETSDYGVGPIFNTAEGFSATYRSRTFQGGFVITQQTLEDGNYAQVRDDAKAFMKRWHADIVEYAMTAISGGFGKEVFFDSGVTKSRLLLTSADTVSGDVNDTAKNPLFTNKHTIVKRDDMSSADIQAAYQSNAFYADLDIGGSDAGQIAKLADVINQVITMQENYLDDNGKIAGVDGSKMIVAPNDPHLKAAINTALSSQSFNVGGGRDPILNLAYNRCTAEYTPYLNALPQCKGGKGFFIVDKAYNAANHGPEFTERIALTMNVENQKKPYGIAYDGRQRFDINVASWRGIAYVHIGDLTVNTPDWATVANFTKIDPVDTIVMPVSVVGEVSTSEA